MFTRTIRVVLAFIAVLTIAAALTMAAGKSPSKNPPTAANPTVTQTIASWPQAARDAATDMVAKYGQPDGVTPEQLTWLNRGRFAEIDVVKQETPHNFPVRHMDCLRQTVYLKVPPEKLDQLVDFDGSIEVNRTRGTVSAFCDTEARNTVILNLANDIINGTKSVPEARQTFADLTDKSSGQPLARTGDPDVSYTQGITFNTLTENTSRDPGTVIWQQGNTMRGMGTGTNTNPNATGTSNNPGMNGTGYNNPGNMPGNTGNMQNDSMRMGGGMNRMGPGMMTRDTGRDTLNTDTTGTKPR